MVSETSFDLAYLETRRSYNEVVQQLRRVVGEHYSPDLLVKHEEQVVKKAYKVTVATILKTSPNQAVSPDWYLIYIGHALWYCCCAKLGVPKETWPPMPVEFDVEGTYDPSKGGAPEHIRAIREAAVREEGRMKQEEGDTAPSSAQNEPIRVIVPAQAQQVRFSDTRDAQQRVPGLLVKDADVTFMKGLWEMYNLGATWALQGELQPWEVKIVASSRSLFFGPEFCHKDRIIDFMAAKGPRKIYTRRLRDDWLVVGLTIPKNHRWGLEKNTASLAELLDSLEGVYGVLYRWAKAVDCGSRQSLAEAIEVDSLRLPRAEGGLEGGEAGSS